MASYKAVMRKQGDFTLYASKYIQDVEALLNLVGDAAAVAVAPIVRKKKKKLKDEEPIEESKD